MILEALVSQIEQRFSHEKRARVCLFFDEKREFSRIVPALALHAAERKPLAFQVLVYDARKHHGQIWLKHSVQRALADAAPGPREHLRFVFYIPLSEDRMDAEGEDGVRLELLEEYRYTGVTFRIGGKRPRLFGFLRQAGVSLPDAPAEQRRLYDGGQDSLLAKYVARFLDRPTTFWSDMVTPELVQSRLVGDADQILFEWAADPAGTWEGLRKNGLEREFLDAARDRYGASPTVSSPEEWIRGVVSTVALTETYLGYAEPTDFPFADRLPPVGVRAYSGQLLQRWLRDTEHRAAWDRQIAAVEGEIDLSEWARDRVGVTFAFPHLVKLRRDRMLGLFEAASAKTSTTAAFFEQHGAAIAKEAELSKASPSAHGEWKLLVDLRTLGGRDQKAVRKTVSGLIKLLHPDGEASKAEIEQYLGYAVELRRRVKEQLKKMGGLEYWDTSFSYTDRESGQETFVRVPEMGGATIIVEGSLPPGASTPSAPTRARAASPCSSSRPR